MGNRSHRRAAFVVGLAVISLALHGCDRPIISGVVLNIRGETLPGVAVHIADTDTDALTNTRGEYRIPYRPGNLRLEFHKSGYTTGYAEFSIDEARPVTATSMQLWRLPSGAGVYLFEDFRYRHCGALEPKRYFRPEGNIVYGIEREAELSTTAPNPVILCHRVPRYGARLTRLEKMEAKLSAASTEVIEIWADAGTIRLDLRPIDGKEGELLELALDQPLESGVYAVHWGALEGDGIVDSRVHLFRVALPPAPEEEGAAENAEGETETDAAEAEATPATE